MRRCENGNRCARASAARPGITESARKPPPPTASLLRAGRRASRRATSAGRASLSHTNAQPRFPVEACAPDRDAPARTPLAEVLHPVLRPRRESSGRPAGHGLGRGKLRAFLDDIGSMGAPTTGRVEVSTVQSSESAHESTRATSPTASSPGSTTESLIPNARPPRDARRNVANVRSGSGPSLVPVL